MSIYGEWKDILPKAMEELVGNISHYNEQAKKQTGHPLYEHFIYRVKDEASMEEKCERKGYKKEPYSALKLIKDAIGLRIITGFRDDIFKLADMITSAEGVKVEEAKDYVTNAKPNGYRSYHLIIKFEYDAEDIEGNTPGEYFAEIQIRTIAMDSWASLEHEMKYKKDIKNTNIIVRELKRCADELESCDISMQTIRDLIREE
ncbi:MAG: GTP pyrophosphokinase family protein [Firmicutes bacterium]|nr:GTP pyrophosphokinase family protein [Bacillota bacterium]